MRESVEHRGVSLNLDWTPGNGSAVDELPPSAGIYAEVCWDKLGVRVGETGKSIRAKIRHDIRWFDAMHDRTAPASQLRRLEMSDPHPIVVEAASEGSAAFEYYVVTDDPRMNDKEMRQECERYLFRWLEEHSDYESWNRQRSWR